MRRVGEFKKHLLLIALSFATVFCAKKETSLDDAQSAADQCVASFFSTNYHYFFNPEEVAQAQENIDCVTSRMIQAQSFVAQSGRSVDLETFQSWLNQKYFSSHPISSQHVASWFVFKSWVAGGSSKEITFDELKALVTLLDQWKLFIQKSHSDLIKIARPSKQLSSGELRSSYDNIIKKMDEFLYYFPNLISKFRYEEFVGLLFHNKAYHNSSAEEIDPSLIRALLWFANGQEKTILSKKTSDFLILIYWEYYKFKNQVGENWSDILWNNKKFISFSVEALDELEILLKKVKIFDYKGFKYLSNYLSKKSFLSEYSVEQIYSFLTTMNESYLSENLGENELKGFGLEQRDSLAKVFHALSQDGKGVQSANSSWIVSDLIGANEEITFVLNNESIIDFSDEAEDPEFIEMANFLSAPLEKVIRSKGLFYINALTESEFNGVLRDFEIFESLWKVEGVSDYFEYARTLGHQDRLIVSGEQLFYFVTRKIQGQNVKDYLVSPEDYSSDH